MTLLLILITALICFFEGIPLLKQKRWKEFLTFLILTGFAFVIGLGKTLGWMSPLELLYQALLPLGKAIFKSY